MNLKFQIFLVFISLAVSCNTFALPYLYTTSCPRTPFIETIYWWPSAYQKGDSYFYSWPRSGDLTFRGTTWVEAINGDAPRNAVIYESTKTTALLYYCRVQTQDQTVYGQLVPDQGCQIGNNIYTSYQVLVR